MAYCVIFLEQDEHPVTRLNDLERKNFRHEAGHAGRKTTGHGRVQVNSSIGNTWLAWVIVLISLPFRLSPRLKRGVHLRVEGWARFRDVCPNSVQVRGVGLFFCNRLPSGLSEYHGRKSEHRQHRKNRIDPSISHGQTLPSFANGVMTARLIGATPQFAMAGLSSRPSAKMILLKLM